MGAEVWNHPHKGGCGAPRLSRQLNERKVETMERFPLNTTGDEGVIKDDKIMWIESKDGIYSIKTPYKAFKLRRQGKFLVSVFKTLGVIESGFLYLEGYLEEGSNFGPL